MTPVLYLFLVSLFNRGKVTRTKFEFLGMTILWASMISAGGIFITYLALRPHEGMEYVVDPPLFIHVFNSPLGLLLLLIPYWMNRNMEDHGFY
ncbi:hypothetical protein JYU19_02585 [bacterium AH-315-J21]|nr:hypothetical protein [bacterium AH-315-J21]